MHSESFDDRETCSPRSPAVYGRIDLEQVSSAALSQRRMKIQKARGPLISVGKGTGLSILIERAKERDTDRSIGAAALIPPASTGATRSGNRRCRRRIRTAQSVWYDHGDVSRLVGDRNLIARTRSRRHDHIHLGKQFGKLADDEFANPHDLDIFDCGIDSCRAPCGGPRASARVAQQL